MTMQGCLTLILFVGLTVWTPFGPVEGERWSRQVSNSEWIPLADPRTAQPGQSQVGHSGVVQALLPDGGAPHLTPLQPVALQQQQQYHQQLQQLQQTQESIQKLLMLQQQLRAQQQILQVQAFLPNGFNSPEEDKEAALRRSTIANLQAVSDPVSEALVPPLPASEVAPPIYQAQNFYSQNIPQLGQDAKQSSQAPKETRTADDVLSEGYKNAQGETIQPSQTRGDVVGSDYPSKQRDFTTRQGGHYKNSKQLREGANDQGSIESHSTPGSVNNDEGGEEEEEEVQLVYVPAETLAQRDQQRAQTGRGRKAYLQQQQYHPDHQQAPEVPSTPLPPVQRIFANQLLEQLQRDQEEKDQLLRDQRLKELARLDEEQRELERQAKLHQETVFRELELQRQREEEKRKELERLEEAVKRRELERLRELREKQRLEEEAAAAAALARQRETQKQEEEEEELERYKLAEIEASEGERRRQEAASQAEADRLAALEKERELKGQQPLEKQRRLQIQRQRAEEAAIKATAHLDLKSQWNSESKDEYEGRGQGVAPQTPVQNRQQHHTEVTKNRGNRVRGRQRQRNHQTQRSDYQSVSSTTTTTTTPPPPPPTTTTTSSTAVTPSPNQPPLSVYMGTVRSDPRGVKISDVLRILKDATSIAVLDSVEPDAPQIFVGPSNLKPPSGYARFDLPYLSSIDNNRVERKVDKLPFFVAPLSFDPPPGYSKIPFPAPHVGSVVVNTLDNLVEQPRETATGPNPSPMPLIEPNSYIESQGQRGSTATSTYKPRTTTASPLSRESPPIPSTAPKYNAEFSTTGSPITRYRYKPLHADDGGAAFTRNRDASNNNKSASSTVSIPYQGERTSPVESKRGPLYDDNSVATTPGYYGGHRVASTPYYQESFVSSTPNYRREPSEPNVEEPTREQDLAAQLALINRELAQHRYNDPAQRPTATAASQLANAFHDVDHAGLLAGLAAINEQRDNLHDEQDWRQPTQQASLPPSGPGIPSQVDDSGKINIGPTQYSFPAELPPISPQLPGLVNSLLEDSDDPVLPGAVAAAAAVAATTTTTTTTTSTTEAPTSTYRIRGRHRGRIVSTRPTTTTTMTTTSAVAPARSSVDRFRRPLSRTRSRHSTTTSTTESYSETAYEPTKAKYSGTTNKYQSQNFHRKQPTVRSQRYRGRNSDRSTVKSETYNDRNIERHDTTGYEAVSTEESRLQQPSTSATNVPVHLQNDYPSSTVNPVETYPSPDSQIPRKIVASSTTSFGADAHSKDPNYSQSVIHGGDHSQGQADFEVSDFGQTGAEAGPANGFNYPFENAETPPSFSTPRSSGDHSSVSGRILEVPSSDPNSQIYETASTIQPGYDTASPKSDFEGTHDERSDLRSSVSIDPNVQPVYDQISRDKQKGHDDNDDDDDDVVADQLGPTVIDRDVPTEVSTTRAPSTVRQRIRGRVYQDPPKQVQPQGSKDEYVRFNTVNQDIGRPGSRQGSRVRPRIRVQAQQGSQVQTEGDEYVRIQAPTQYQRSTTAATKTPTTTTTTTTVVTMAQEPKEELEYGFIRTPNFHPVHPVDRLRVPAVTLRPTLNEVQVQTAVPPDNLAVEVNPSQAQILKNRQKYHVMTRRPLTKVVTTTASPSPASTTTTRVSPVTGSSDNNKVYTVKPKTRPEEPKPTRIRGKIRKPGRRRTTTTTSTTELTLDSNNELPLDENYPRVVQASPPRLQFVGQQVLYDDNLENASPLASLLGRPAQLQGADDQNQLNDFVINFGAVPGQGAPHEEYDQTQLASSSSGRYGQSSRSVSGDIEGAESQWSTKLTRNSFQPSRSPNRVEGNEEIPRRNVEREGSDDDYPDIVTAGRPEVLPSAVGILVASSVGDGNRASRIALTASTVRQGVDTVDVTESSGNVRIQGEYRATEDGKSDGEQRNATDYDVGSMTAGGNVPGNNGTSEEKNRISSVSVSRGVVGENAGNRTTTMASDLEDDNTAEMTTIGSTPDSLVVRKTGQKRRRVRVRVRPAVDDIATAESQYLGSAINDLARGNGYDDDDDDDDDDEYDYFRHFQYATDRSVPLATEETTAAPWRFVSKLFSEETSTLSNDDARMTTVVGQDADRLDGVRMPTSSILQEDGRDSTENDTANSAEYPTTTTTTTKTVMRSRELVSHHHRTKTYHSVEEVEDLKVTRNKLTALDNDDDDGSSEPDESRYSKYRPQGNDEMATYDHRPWNGWKDVEPSRSTSGRHSEDPSPLENFAEVELHKDEPSSVVTTSTRRNVVDVTASPWLSDKRNSPTSMTTEEDLRDVEEREVESTQSHPREMHDDESTSAIDVPAKAVQSSSRSAGEEGSSHPKNHRIKWSEVKDSSNRSLVLDYSGFALGHDDGTSTDGSGEDSEPKVNVPTDTTVRNVEMILEETRNDEGNGELLVDSNDARVAEREGQVSEAVKPEIGTLLDESTEDRNDLSLVGARVDERYEGGSRSGVAESSTSTSVTVSVSVSTGQVLTEARSIGPTTDAEESRIITTETTMQEGMVSETAPSLAAISELDLAVPQDESTTELPATENSLSPRNSTGSNLGKILRTSTTTKVSHMTEICYRGRCVMTKPKKEVRAR